MLAPGGTDSSDQGCATTALSHFQHLHSSVALTKLKKSCIKWSTNHASTLYNRSTNHASTMYTIALMMHLTTTTVLPGKPAFSNSCIGFLSFNIPGLLPFLPLRLSLLIMISLCDKIAMAFGTSHYVAVFFLAPTVIISLE